MSSVLDTIKRVFGRARGQRPDPGANSEAAPPPSAGAAEPAMPSAAGAPPLAMPGEEAELPIQPTAPPPNMTSPPLPSFPPAGTEPPVDASAVTEGMGESTETEQEAEPTGQPSDDAMAEPLGQGHVQDLQAPVGLVEETVQHSVVEQPLAAAAGPATESGDTVHALVVEGPGAELEGREQAMEGQEQAVEDEPLAPAPSQGSPVSPEALEPVESTPTGLPTQPEESPEQQTALESPAQDEDQ